MATTYEAAAVAVRMAVEGLDPTVSALERLEAVGQRVGKSIGTITARIVGGQVATQQAEAIATAVNRAAASVKPITLRMTVPQSAQTLAVISQAVAASESLARRVGAEATGARAAAAAEQELARARTAAADAAARADATARGLAQRGLAVGAALSARGGASAATAAPPTASPITLLAPDPRPAVAAIAQVADALTKLGIQSRIVGDGIRVPTDDVDRARAEVERLNAAVTVTGEAFRRVPATIPPLNVRPAVSAITQVADALTALGVQTRLVGRGIQVPTEDVAQARAEVQRLGASVTVTAGQFTAAGGAASNAGRVAAAAARDAAREEVQRAAVAQRTTAVVERQGNVAAGTGPKFRAAASGLTALAFAASAGTQNFQSMALAAGLAVSSLAEIGGAAGKAAGGIGAAITVGVALYGVYERLRAKGKATGEELKALGTIRSTEQATRAAEQLERQYGLIQQRLRELRTMPNPLAVLPGARDLFEIYRDYQTLGTRQRGEAVRERITAIRGSAEEEGIGERRTREELDARRTALVEGLRAENAVVGAAGDARVAAERQRYEAGLRDLSAYTAARIATSRADAAREVAMLRAQQAALRDPAGRGRETTPETSTRLAEATRLDAEIRTIRTRAQAEEAAAVAERAAQEKALAARVVAAGAEVLAARGQQHRAELAQIAERTEAYRVLLAQEGRLAPAQQANAVTVYRDTLTAMARAAEVQREIARERATLAAERAEIEARVARGPAGGGITAVEGQRAIAAAEAARLPVLRTLAAELDRIGTSLNNADLLNAARQLRAEFAAMGPALTPLQDRLNGVLNDLAGRGTAMAERIADGIRSRFGAALVRAVQQSAASLAPIAVTVAVAVTPKVTQTAEIGQLLEQTLESNRQRALGAGIALGQGIADAAVGAFSAGFEALGRGSNLDGTWKAFAATLMGGLGSALKAFGTAALMASTLMAKFLAAMAHMNPFVAIPLAGAMIALGSMLGGAAQRAFGGNSGSTGVSSAAPSSAPGGSGGVKITYIIGAGTVTKTEGEDAPYRSGSGTGVRTAKPRGAAASGISLAPAVASGFREVGALSPQAAAAGGLGARAAALASVAGAAAAAAGAGGTGVTVPGKSPGVSITSRSAQITVPGAAAGRAPAVRNLVVMQPTFIGEPSPRQMREFKQLIERSQAI